MEKQRSENNSSNSGAENVNGRNSDHNDRGASNKVLPFSIEAILSAPHPKKETPVTRKRPHSYSQESFTDWASPLSTLEDFTSSNLPEDKSASAENAEIGRMKTLLLFNSTNNSQEILVGSNSALALESFYSLKLVNISNNFVLSIKSASTPV